MRLPITRAIRFTALALASLAAAPIFAEEACRPDRVEIRSDNGVARFRVELAVTPEERARGLMFREQMSSGAGMFFVFEAPGPRSFWMKNTLIPLDILYLNPDGRVQAIRTGKPQDTTSLPGGDNVQYVLEINGGLAARMGIAPGAVLRHPQIDPALAAWPCAASDPVAPVEGDGPLPEPATDAAGEADAGSAPAPVLQ